jgi:cytochrome c-type biogenesis protein CcmH/NrfG
MIGVVAMAGAVYFVTSIATNADDARSATTGSLSNTTSMTDGLPAGLVPIDRETMLADATIAAEQGLVLEAADRYNALLDTNPNDAVALAYYGWMLSRAAASDPSLTSLEADAVVLLDRAVAADPDLPDARWFRAVVRTVGGDIEGARADLAIFVELSPDAAHDRAVGELKAQLDSQVD